MHICWYVSYLYTHARTRFTCMPAYEDTEGSFAVDRLVEMAEALLQHLNAQADTQEKRAALAHISLTTILDTVYCFRVHDYVQQIAIVSAASSRFSHVRLTPPRHAPINTGPIPKGEARCY